jgi:hypothetical protein
MNRDTLSLIALELDPSTLLSLCQTNKKLNTIICKNNYFWKKKLNKDYPTTVNKFSENADFKKIYESLFTQKINRYVTFIDNDELSDLILKESDYDDMSYEKYVEIAEILGFEFTHFDAMTFQVVGDFPKGTEIWFAYDGSDYYHSATYLTEIEAIKKHLNTIKNIFIYDRKEGMEGVIAHEMIDNLNIPNAYVNDNYFKFVEENKEYIQSKVDEYLIKFYGSNNLEEVLENAKNELTKNGIYKLYNSDTEDYSNLIIKKFTL